MKRKTTPGGYWVEVVTSPVWFPALAAFSLMVYVAWWVRAEFFDYGKDR